MTARQKILLKTVVFTLIAVLGTYFLFICASFIAAYVSTRDEVVFWTEWQQKYVAALEANYKAGTASKVNEQDFCDFDLTKALTSGTKINELRMLATHNSYKQGTTTATNIFYNYALPVLLGKKYDYTFDTITEQFNHGIRSIEIDLGKVKIDDGFEVRVYHNALTEAGSSMINFELGLKEMKMWSDYNPSHLPVFVLVELKGGSISPYVDFDPESIAYVDETISRIMGDSLFTPADAIGKYENFGALRASNGYPALKTMLGKFVFLFHETSRIDDYASLDETFLSQKMFIALKEKQGKLASPEYLDKAMFIILNNPENNRQKPLVEMAVEENFIIRTRLDEYALISDERFAAAMECGAQILSTDYPPATENRYGYTVKICESGKTIILRNK